MDKTAFFLQAIKALPIISFMAFSSCTSHFAALRNDSEKYDVALEEMRIEIGDLKQELHSARVELQLLEEKIEEAPVGQHRSISREEFALLQSKIQMLEKNQERALADLRSLSSHAQQTSDALRQYRNHVQNFETKQLSTHRVKKGDSLEKIASQYHTTVANLKQLNHLNSDTIVVGQELIVRDDR